MVEEDPESALLLRAGGRTIHPSPDELQQIREAVVVVTEIFESLIQVATDDRTVAGLQAGGNGEALGPTPGDLQDIAQELSGALTALSGNVLDSRARSTVDQPPKITNQMSQTLLVTDVHHHRRADHLG
jgi:hypothetical protein